MLYTKNGTGIFPCWQFKYWKSEDRPDGEGQKTVKIKCLADQIQAIRNIRSSQPIGSTYGLFTCIGIYHKNHPNLCKHIPIPWILWAMVFVETTLCVCGSNQYGFQHPAPFSLVFFKTNLLKTVIPPEGWCSDGMFWGGPVIPPNPRCDWKPIGLWFQGWIQQRFFLTIPIRIHGTGIFTSMNGWFVW